MHTQRREVRQVEGEGREESKEWREAATSEEEQVVGVTWRRGEVGEEERQEEKWGLCGEEVVDLEVVPPGLLLPRQLPQEGRGGGEGGAGGAWGGWRVN